MRTAILVIGFKRLSYFQQTLESLERNPESQTLDFYFYLDGGRESRQDELIEMINTSSIKNKHIVCRESNYGIGRHLIGARREIFDGLGYDRGNMPMSVRPKGGPKGSAGPIDSRRVDSWGVTDV